VDVQEAVLLEGARPFGEEFPAAFARGAILAWDLELRARPENRFLGRLVKTIGIEHRALIVIAEQNDFAAHHQIDTLSWIRTVTNDIAEAVNLLDVVLFDILEHSLECFEVAMDVADDCLHAVTPPGERLRREPALSHFFVPNRRTRPVRACNDLIESVLPVWKRCQGATS